MPMCRRSCRSRPKARHCSMTASVSCCSPFCCALRQPEKVLASLAPTLPSSWCGRPAAASRSAWRRAMWRTAMRLIDDYAVEVLISVALVTGTYALAHHLDVSGPLSMVAAGLLIGDRGPRYAMSERTQSYLFALWTLVDEILNSVLFLLIGLETLILRFDLRSLGLAAASIPVVLFARFVSVSVQPFLFGWTQL